jgi:hypothetical protein
LQKGLFWHAKQALLQSIDNEMVKEYGRICLIRSYLNTAFLYINKVEDEANRI